MIRVPVLPPKAPRRSRAIGRWLGRTVLGLGGWRIEGDWPDLARMVVIVAPHSSAWDAIWGIAAKLAMGVDIVFMAKKEAFVGPIGWALRYFGGQPFDRKAASGLIGQAVAGIRGAEKRWFVLAPEGTRRQVEKWRSGFWHIAR
ncbi:MAG TPA: 1-acyl-sn-glycerol-3-phosphate acyltransferase, partial [Arenimonas sp.]|nr:1-acyl-sn-glycerol-3-phosphate acyltransferase [Arenimonas sp.]